MGATTKVSNRHSGGRWGLAAASLSCLTVLIWWWFSAHGRSGGDAGPRAKPAIAGVGKAKPESKADFSDIRITNTLQSPPPAPGPGTWQPAKEFRDSHPHWRPLPNFVLKRDLTDALQINREQEEKLRIWLKDFRATCGRIQGDDFVVVTSPKGEQIAWLKPVAKNWEGVKAQFEGRLRDILGELKAKYVIDASWNEITALTGGYGTLSRIATINESAAYADYKAGKYPASWAPPGRFEISMETGMGIIGHEQYFEPELRQKLNRQAVTAPLVFRYWGGCDTPLDFISGIFAKDKTSEAPVTP